MTAACWHLREVRLLQSAKDGQCCQREARTALQGHEVNPLSSLVSVVAHHYPFPYLPLIIRPTALSQNVDTWYTCLVLIPGTVLNSTYRYN